MSDSKHSTGLFILSGGGFTFENICLLRTLGPHVRPVYLVTHFGGRPGDPGIPPGPDYDVPQFASVTRRSRRASINAFIRTFLITKAAIRRERIDVIVAVGCSHSVPMLLAGRLAGCPTVFVESITRADRLSVTGRIVYHARLASLFIVQWPRLQSALPASRLGTIL